MHVRDSRPAPLRFHGGALGALMPFLVFLGGATTLALRGAPDERGFWPVLVLALLVSLLLCRDRGAWSDAVVEGATSPLVTLMIFAWLLAGILAVVLREGGLVGSLAGGAQALDVRGGAFCAAAFVVAALVATATGTSLGTLLLTVPLLYPAGAALDSHPVVLIGALLGGATFGDNVSPVSDTTIASATTQGSTIAAAVRSRLIYALPAAAAAFLAYGLLGRSTAAQPGPARPLPQDASGLMLLLAPAAVIALLLRRRHLVEGLLVGNAVALTLALVLGRLPPSRLLAIDRDAFVARSIVIDGLERAVGISIFTLLLMALLGPLEKSALLERALERLAPPGASLSLRRAECQIVALVSVAVLLTTHAVVAMMMVGRAARELGERAGVPPPRRANLLDLTVSTYPFLLPWFIPTILAASLTAHGREAGLPAVSALAAGLANAHSWALVVMTALALAAGFGRRGERRASGG